MLDLYTALRLTRTSDNECVYLIKKSFPDRYEVLTGRRVKEKYDVRKVKVIHILPWVICGDFQGMEFEIVL